MTLLKELVEHQGLTIVLVAHEQEVANYARRVIRMRDGRIIEDSGGVTVGVDAHQAPADGLEREKQ